MLTKLVLRPLISRVRRARDDSEDEEEEAEEDGEDRDGGESKKKKEEEEKAGGCEAACGIALGVLSLDSKGSRRLGK